MQVHGNTRMVFSLRSRWSAVRIGPGVPLKPFGFFGPTTHFAPVPLQNPHYRSTTVSKRDFLTTAVSQPFSRIGFAGFAVELLQGFAFHLQLHLRLPFESLCVRLSEHLCYPFIGDAAC